MTSFVKRVVIVGGGTAGWMSAASLRRFLPTSIAITLVGSPDVPTVGVGEATLPGIREFNASLGIDELEFLRATKATFKLGIVFRDWFKPGTMFTHPFSSYGTPIGGVPFLHAWLRVYEAPQVCDLQKYSLSSELCLNQLFAQPPSAPQNELFDYQYAFHFDAALYAEYLKSIAVNAGVEHRSALVDNVCIDPETGLITAFQLKGQKEQKGDLFVDCSGARSLLLGQGLAVPFEDWSHWLPVNSAVW